jgi:2-(3-amino-3-carboxypropyl)histidine synthase
MSACCIDDLGAKALGADLLVHYGHSCLVPLTTTEIPCLYVFVEIRVDVQHLIDCFCKTCPVGTRVHVMGTVQFRPAVAAAAKALNERERPATIPQAKPLSPGEVLGCTAPANLGGLENVNCGDEQCESSNVSSEHVMLFIADGRFHLEAAMIANPTLRALRYDPYSKLLTDEKYETDKMKSIRKKAITKAMDPSAKVFGVILGTLGRQGNPAILGHVRSLLQKHGKRSFVLLLSEIFPKKLDMFTQVDVWVQIACPRLSVDWGHFFTKPVLSAYELNVALDEEKWREVYPMDFYTVNSGRWSNYHEDNRNRTICNEA